MEHREENSTMNTEPLRIAATAAVPPTTGPWLVACSDCGALEVALSGDVADRVVMNHLATHTQEKVAR